VKGTVRGSTVRTTGDMCILKLGAAVGSDFLAGVAPEVGRHAEGHDDFVNPAARIGYVKIMGLPDAPSAERLLVDSNFSAARVGSLRLKNMQTSNDGQDFGVFVRHTGGGNEVQQIKHKDTATGDVWRWRPPKQTLPGEALRKGDFVVRIL
jgi:hypothetical protein